MNDDPAPLEPGELDELLSADLDGELAAAAREHGSDADTIRARIAATPHATERRAALAAARDVLAEPPALDELVAARLRAKAVRAADADGEARATARHDRRNRVLLAGSGIAASILVVAAIAVAAGHSSSSSSSKNAAAAPPSTTSGRRLDLTQPVPTLGSYTDAGALGSVAVNAAQQRAAEKLVLGRAKAAIPSHSTTSPHAGAVPPTFAVQDGSSNDSARYGTGAGTSAAPTAGSASSQGTAGSTQCSAAKFARSGDQLSLHASATLAGRPVQVYVFVGDGEHTVVVLGPTCELVNVQTVG